MTASILIHPRATNAELLRIVRAGYKVIPQSGKRYSAVGVPAKSLPSRVWDRIKDKLCGV